MHYELGIIGAGNMAEAITRGVIRAGLLAPDQIVADRDRDHEAAIDVAPARREVVSRGTGVRAVESNEDAARAARTLLLSVKPQQMAQALAGIGAVLDPAALVVSIAAGITTSFIEQHLGGGRRWRVVRAMPNTPMLVGEGMTAVARGSNASAHDQAAARRLFESAGAVGGDAPARVQRRTLHHETPRRVAAGTIIHRHRMKCGAAERERRAIVRRLIDAAV